MALIAGRKKQVVNEPKVKITWKEVKRQKVLLIWTAIIVLYGIIFCYLPLGGWVMAFQNYKPKDGLLHSEFVGLAKFVQLFSDATFLKVIRTTRQARISLYQRPLNSRASMSNDTVSSSPT